jgi:hypothetical protein
MIDLREMSTNWLNTSDVLSQGFLCYGIGCVCAGRYQNLNQEHMFSVICEEENCLASTVYIYVKGLAMSSSVLWYT